MRELTELLDELKKRSGLRYAQLARRCHVSGSTLHRYCRGHVLPGSHGMVERIALACGAERDELAELYRAWERADAERTGAAHSSAPEQGLRQEPESAQGSEEPGRRFPVARWAAVAYELWALAPSAHFWTGDASTLARMAQRAGAVIRRADPRATIVCPSMGDMWEEASQRFPRDFAAAGGYQYCDVAGVKLHTRRDGDAPESLVGLGPVIDRAFHRGGVHPAPWNTGTAYRVAEDQPLGTAYAAAYAVRFHLVGMYRRSRPRRALRMARPDPYRRPGRSSR